MNKILKILVTGVALLAILTPVGLAVASSTDVIKYPSGVRYYPGDEIIEERSRTSKTYYEGNGVYRAEFVGSPEFTKSENQWVDYVFADKGTYYQIQHPWSSAKFYDYYTEVWNEEFTEVKIYDDRWVVEYQNKQGKWIDADFYNITRSYEEVADGIKVKRTGSTDIGQRQETYYFRNGSPCKIEIQQTCNETQVIRFVWKPSGIVADNEQNIVEEFGEHEGKVSGLNFYDTSDFFLTMRWYDELSICSDITPVCEVHAQGRKATVTFSEFNVSAGETAILDPTTFYSSASDGGGYAGPDALYADAHNNPNADTIRAAQTELKPTNTKSGADFYVERVWLYFPGTITLGATASISAADLSIYGSATQTQTNAGQAVNGIFEGVQSDPFDAADFGDHLLKTTLGADTYYAHPLANAYNSKALNATGIGWINKTGTTLFCIRNYGDVNNAIPTGANQNFFFASEEGAGKKPRLVVTFTVPPTVVTLNATGVVNQAATLSGNVTDIGDTVIVERGFVWDTANLTDPGDTHPSSSNFTWWWTEVGSFGTGVFSHDITGLSCNTTYYFRAGASNNVTWAYGNGLSFTTTGGGLPSVPANLTLTDLGANTVNITWTMGTCADTTEIRVKRESCPTGITDGESAYSGNLTSANYTGLSLSTTSYCFTALSHNAIGYSANNTCVCIGGEDMEELAENMWLFVLVLLPLGLTVVMFATRNAMLGFPCGIFWAIFGAACFLESETPWGDIYFYLFFASAFGMVIFTILAAFGLRERRDTLADEEMEKGDKGYFDEGKSDEGKSDEGRDKTDALFAIEEEPKPSKRTRELRERTKERRTGG